MPARSNSSTPIEPKTALTSIGLVVYDWDLATDTITWGPNAAAVLGLSDLDSLSTGEAFSLATTPCDGETRAHVIQASGERDDGAGIAYQARYALRLKGDRLVAVEDTGRWYADAAGKPTVAHGVLRVAPLGSSGRATDAPPESRATFIARIADEIADLVRRGQSMTLVVGALDYDGDAVHRGDGIRGGEAVVAEVLKRIRRIVRRRDQLAVTGTDRFALALMSCPASEAESAMKRLAGLVESQPIQTADGPVSVRLRLGAASIPHGAPTAAELLLCAEDALAPGQRSLEDAVAAVPSLPPAEHLVSAGTSPIDIIDALNDRRLVLGFQPVVDAQTRAPVFAWALPRFQTPDGRLAAIGDLAVRIDSAQIAPLVDARVLELAADALAADPHQHLAIRISPLTLADSDWLATLAAHLGARPGIESRLIIAIPERAVARDPGAFRAKLDAMKAVGIAVALDDFGAGYTSLKHLRGFPVDLLTLDPAFVQILSRSPDDRFFVRSAVDLAHHFGIATVAAGLDDEEAARLLAEWGVDYLHSLHSAAPVQPALPRRLGVA